MKHEGCAQQGRSKKFWKYFVTTSYSENGPESIKNENHA
jgi:hypothetical protein